MNEKRLQLSLLCWVWLRAATGHLASVASIQIDQDESDTVLPELVISYEVRNFEDGPVTKNLSS